MRLPVHCTLSTTGTDPAKHPSAQDHGRRPPARTLANPVGLRARNVYDVLLVCAILTNEHACPRGNIKHDRAQVPG